MLIPNLTIGQQEFDAYNDCGGGANYYTVQIAGNNTLKKNTGIGCEGINFQSNRQNLMLQVLLIFIWIFTLQRLI